MKTNRLSRFALPLLSTLLAATSVAHAHSGHAAAPGFLHGLAHPLGGWDHLLAMLAVGLWAAQLATTNRRAVWAVPATFVGVMAFGGLLGASGIALSGVETGITASVLVLGVLIAAAVRLPLAASMAVVGAFALLHGHAHGAEMPAAASGLSYGAGFVLATVLLHAAGLGAALGAQQLFAARHLLPLRFAGSAIAFGGLLLAVLG